MHEGEMYLYGSFDEVMMVGNLERTPVTDKNGMTLDVVGRMAIQRRDDSAIPQQRLLSSVKPLQPYY